MAWEECLARGSQPLVHQDPGVVTRVLISVVLEKIQEMLGHEWTASHTAHEWQMPPAPAAPSLVSSGSLSVVQNPAGLLISAGHA